MAVLVVTVLSALYRDPHTLTLSSRDLLSKNLEKQMTDSTEQAVLVERRGRVMVITLNRPDAMNAINGALSHGLLNAVQELDADDSLTAGVITGNGRGFCSAPTHVPNVRELDFVSHFPGSVHDLRWG